MIQISIKQSLFYWFTDEGFRNVKTTTYKISWPRDYSGLAVPGPCQKLQGKIIEMSSFWPREICGAVLGSVYVLCVLFTDYLEVTEGDLDG